MTPSPTHDLRCGQCRTFLNKLPFKVLFQGLVRRAPEQPDVLIFAHCGDCGATSRYEIVPGTGYEALNSRMDYQEAA